MQQTVEYTDTLFGETIFGETLLLRNQMKMKFVL